MDTGGKRSKSPLNYSVSYQALGSLKPLNISPVNTIASPTYKKRPITNLYSPTSVVKRVPSPSGHANILRKESRETNVSRNELPAQQTSSPVPPNDKYRQLLDKCEELFKVNQELADKFESTYTDTDINQRESLSQMRKKYQQLGSIHVNRLKKLTIDKEELKSKLTKHEEIIKQLSEQLIFKDKQISELKKSDQQLRDLNENIKKKNQKLVIAFQEGIKQKEQITQLEKRLADAQSSMEVSFRMSQSYASQIDIEPYELKSRLSDIEHQLRRKNQELELEQQKNLKLKESLAKYEMDYGSQMDLIKSENQQLKSKNIDLQRNQLDLESQITLLSIEFDHKTKRYKDQQEHSNIQIEQLLKLNDEFQSRISELEGKLDDLRTRFKHHKDKESVNPGILRNEQAQKLVYEKKISEQQESIQKLQRELADLKQKYAKVDAIEDQITDDKIQFAGLKPIGEADINNDTTANLDSEKSYLSPCSEENLKQDQSLEDNPIVARSSGQYVQIRRDSEL